MSDKYREVKLPPNRVERIPNEDVHVDAQYFAEDAARDLETSMGDQADELTVPEDLTSGDDTTAPEDGSDAGDSGDTGDGGTDEPQE